MWDTEVDIAVIGAGIGGLANAIAAVDAGGDVLVVDAVPPLRGDFAPVAVRERAVALRSGLLPETLDIETNEYFAALVDGVDESRDVLEDSAVPRRIARNLSREEVSARFVEPFIGSRLASWSAQCLSSPYGLMYSSVRNWPTTTMRSFGESIEVLSIGAIDWAAGCGEGALRQWIGEQSRQRDIEVQAHTSLQRIVFEEGVVIGVVLDTPDGPYAVQTRSGVSLASRDQDPLFEDAVDSTAGGLLQVCLVGRTASRFGRVELLATEPVTARPTCTGSRRQLREGMHEARQSPLDGWRCG